MPSSYHLPVPLNMTQSAAARSPQSSAILSLDDCSAGLTELLSLSRRMSLCLASVDADTVDSSAKSIIEQFHQTLAAVRRSMVHHTLHPEANVATSASKTDAVDSSSNQAHHQSKPASASAATMLSANSTNMQSSYLDSLMAQVDQIANDSDSQSDDDLS